MRYRMFILALIVVVACGAGPFRGRFSRSVQYLANPGVVGPGPGVIASGSANANRPGPQANAQISFQGMEGMILQWDVFAPESFDSQPLICPGVQNFEMGKVYRLKVSSIPNRDGLVLYPTLEVNSVTPRTSAYLDHNAIPVTFTDNDFDQVQSGNFVTKVIFLPSPEFQSLAVTGGVDTIVNTQLPPGADPVVEAQNRGAILAVVKIGNKDLSLPGSSSVNAMGGLPNQVPQIPISGVNVPAFGSANTVTPYGVPGPAVLPSADQQSAKVPLIQPINPNPATEVPGVRNNWKGSNF